MNRATITNIVVFVAGAGLGTGVTYFLTKRALEQRSDREIEEVKTYYRKRYKEGEFSTPESAAEALSRAIAEEPGEADSFEEVTNDIARKFVRREAEKIVRDMGYTATEEDEDEETLAEAEERVDAETDEEDENDIPSDEEIMNRIVHKNVFTESKEDVLGMLILERNEQEPHIITEEEYLHDEEDYDQIELTYYAEDNVLCDIRERIVNIDDSVGQANLERFGVGSSSPHTLHIRNRLYAAQYEITKHEKSYAKEVFDQDPEALTQKRDQLRRMRRTNED